MRSSFEEMPESYQNSRKKPMHQGMPRKLLKKTLIKSDQRGGDILQRTESEKREGNNLWNA